MVLQRDEVIKVLTYNLNISVAPRETRLSSLNELIQFIDHEDPRQHDEELAHGIANPLFTKLAYAFTVSPMDDEVGIIAAALEVIYRGASREEIGKSYFEIGSTMLPMLVDMVTMKKMTPANVGEVLLEKDDRLPAIQERVPGGYSNGDYEDSCHSTAVSKTLKILRYYSRILTVMVPMAHYPGFLDKMVSRLNTKWLDNLEEKDDDEESNATSELSDDMGEINKTDADMIILKKKMMIKKAMS
eukprot:CAMPEP_0194392944 /NCGR_PEP_ID=MMETSP0174-20130528/123018_1 /TAXON_ID=216777 /ORGANISM="Proboscia alata, Strain PI-D3" /LENGTH=243 /DNA_ID=CAMNT_0039188563 /DNA_START=87 /DNA_END=818 /DNA_ORIENTATION=-